MIGRLSAAAVSASVVPTLRAVHAAEGGTWARATIAQLVALLEHVEVLAPSVSQIGVKPLEPRGAP